MFQRSSSLYSRVATHASLNAPNLNAPKNLFAIIPPFLDTLLRTFQVTYTHFENGFEISFAGTTGFCGFSVLQSGKKALVFVKRNLFFNFEGCTDFDRFFEFYTNF